MANEVFKYLTSINNGVTIDVEKDYNKFLTARGLSYHLDCVLLANEVNLYRDIEPQMHYDFLRSIITPRKRFGKWSKPVKHPVAAAISIYFQIPMEEAYQQVDFYTEDEIAEITEIVMQKD